MLPSDHGAAEKSGKKGKKSAPRGSLSLDKMSLANSGGQPSRKQRCASAGRLLYDGSRVCAVASCVTSYHRRLPMSLPASPRDIIPEQTIEVARAAFPKGNPDIRMRDALGPLSTHPTFAALFAHTG